MRFFIAGILFLTALMVRAGNPTFPQVTNIIDSFPPQNVIWVSPFGNDTNSGTQNAPFLNISNAVDAAGKVSSANNRWQVHVTPGSYRVVTAIFTNSVSLFADSGAQITHVPGGTIAMFYEFTNMSGGMRIYGRADYFQRANNSTGMFVPGGNVSFQTNFFQANSIVSSNGSQAKIIDEGDHNVNYVDIPYVDADAGLTTYLGSHGFSTWYLLNSPTIFIHAPMVDALDTVNVLGGYFTLDPDSSLAASSVTFNLTGGTFDGNLLNDSGSIMNFCGAFVTDTNFVADAGLGLNTTNGYCITTNGVTINFSIPALHNYVQTNLVIGTIYTNNQNNYLSISGLSIVATQAAVAGRNSVQVQISGATGTGYTNSIYNDITAATQLFTGSVTNSPLSIYIPPYSTYKFVDTSTGAGNSCSLSGGQRFY